MDSLVTIYTDGACIPNPGKGGWGASLRFKNTYIEIYGYEPQATNNRMELSAAMFALAKLNRPSNVIVYSDSKYVVDGMSKWYPNWKKKGKTDYLNQGLWEQIGDIASIHSITWQWVRGHAGNPGNERADELAMMGLTTESNQF